MNRRNFLTQIGIVTSVGLIASKMKAVLGFSAFTKDSSADVSQFIVKDGPNYIRGTIHDCNEESRTLYGGKFFYKVCHKEDSQGRWRGQYYLRGPLNNILYITPGTSAHSRGYKFAEVINGRVLQVFNENEILVFSKEI